MSPRSTTPFVKEGNLDKKPEEKVLTLEDAYGQYYNSYKTLWGLVAAPIIWSVAFALIFFHAVALVCLFTFPFTQKLGTVAWNIFIGAFSLFGVTAGVHRYWSHRSYKATLPMRILLGFAYSMTGQFSIFKWVRTHRIHHKFSDTVADPHDIVSRGAFFSQVGFCALEKHPECKRKGAQVDCSDLLEDSVVKFNMDHFWLVNGFCHYLFPTVFPMLWGETLYWSFLINSLRFVVTVTLAGMVNSVNHMIGTKPYNENHKSTDARWFAFLTLGESYHNYHHAFPYDYKASELFSDLNLTTFLLDCFAKIGWVYDRRSAPAEAVERQVSKNGDGSHEIYAKINADK